MDQVKVNGRPKRNYYQREDEPDRMFFPIQVKGQQIIGIAPHKKDFVCCRDGDATRTAPEDVVPYLVVAEILTVSTVQVSGIKLAFGALAFVGIKVKV